MSQILNFGVPAPIDIQIVGSEPEEPRRRQSAARFAAPRAGARRTCASSRCSISRSCECPTDRSRAAAARHQPARHRQQSAARRSRAAARSRRPSGSTPRTGLQYPLVTQAPQYRMTSLQDLQNLPIARAGQTADPRRPGDHHAAASAPRSSRTTTRSRSSTSSARYRTATSARSHKDINAADRRTRTASCRRARTSSCAARCRR